MNRSLLILEKNPSEPEALKEIFRAAHTLKGMSATMGYEPMARLSHEMESALEPIRSGRRALNGSLVDVLFACLDQLESWTRDLVQSDRLESAPLTTLLTRLQVAGSAVLTPDSPPVQTPSSIVTAAPAVEAPLPEARFQFDDREREVLTQARTGGFSVFRVSVSMDPTCAFKEVRAFMVLRNVNALGEVVRSEPSPEDIEAGRYGQGFHLVVVTDKPAGDLQKSLAGISEITSVQVEPYRELPTAPPGTNPARIQDGDVRMEAPANAPVAPKEDRITVAPTVRVHTSKLDRLMALVQELVIAKIRFEQTAAVAGMESLRSPFRTCITSRPNSRTSSPRCVWSPCRSFSSVSPGWCATCPRPSARKWNWCWRGAGSNLTGPSSTR